MEQEFHRIKRLPPYVFNEVNEMKAKARAAGEDIIDFGMGNPDQPTPPHIVAKLVETIADPRTHRYSASRGIPGLRKALAGYYARRFNVSLDPNSEVIATLGSKEGLANLASAITSPGDVILVPNPSYPIHQFGFIIADGAVRNVPVVPDGDFFKALETAVIHSVPKPRALVLNYPNNPTALTCDLAFYEQAVDFCRFHEIYILSDIAYSELYFDGVPPPSILQVPRAREIAVEFSSMSKTYSMPGWRIGFAAGNKHLIAALARIKSYLDYGAFTPIQVAATAALNGPQDCVDEIRALYKGRRDTLIESMDQAGWHIPSPNSTMFAWAPLPPAFRHMGSNEFAKLILTEAQVAVSPGIAFGEHGDGHVRIGLVENRQRIRQAARNVKAFLSRYDKVLEESERRRAVGA
jgi:alanine-synthesizing transaminase